MREALNQFPIDVSAFEGFLPHRPPMLWIDQVISLNEKGGSCLVIFDKKKHYFDKSKIRQSSTIEWMAQAYGFVSIAKTLILEEEIKLNQVFMAGFSKVEFLDEIPIDAKKVKINVLLKIKMGPMSVVQAEVVSTEESHNIIYVKADLKLFAS